MKKYLVFIWVLIFTGVVFCGKADSLNSGKKIVKKSIVKNSTNKSLSNKQHQCDKECTAECKEKCKNSTDYFVDKDNDGICDNRAKGMGFNSKNRCSGNGCKGQIKNKTK